MHIETLKIFCDLAEMKSFSKAAEKNMISQSAISQQLAQLEMMYKSQLISRKKRPTELTTAGKLFYASAKQIIEHFDQLQHDLKNLKNAEQQRINIGAIFSIGMHTLPEYVKTFMMHNPHVHVHVEYLSAETIYQMVLDSDIDIGLVAVPKRDKRLHVYDFQDEPLVLACHTKHPLANRDQIDIHTIQFERFIGFSRDVPTRIWIDHILARFNMTVEPVMEFDNIETIKRAVEINQGISILPQTALSPEINGGALRAIHFMQESFIRPTGIIVRKNKHLSEGVKKFIDLLIKKQLS